MVVSRQRLITCHHVYEYMRGNCFPAALNKSEYSVQYCLRAGNRAEPKATQKPRCWQGSYDVVSYGFSGSLFFILQSAGTFGVSAGQSEFFPHEFNGGENNVI